MSSDTSPLDAISSYVTGRRNLLRGALALGGAAALGPTLASCASPSSPTAGGKTTITIANVANPLTTTLEKHTKSVFEKANPDLSITFLTLPETELRQRVTRDVSTGAGEFDAVVIGPYEIAVWTQNGWLEPLEQMAAADSAYQLDDLMPMTRSYLSADNKLYGAPIYAESACLMYRQDVLSKLGITVPEAPAWPDMLNLAREVHGTQFEGKTLTGTTMRGIAGEILTPLLPMVSTYGGRIVAPDWAPTLLEEPTLQAITDYVSLLQETGQPSVATAGYTESLASMGQGQSVFWIDSTVAGATLEDPSQSTVAGKLGYALAPHKQTDFGGNFWSWALSILSSSKKKEATWRFLSWATSLDYLKVVAEDSGWATVPPGTRQSLYDIPEYLKATPNAKVTLKSFELGSAPDSEVILKPTAPGRPVSYFDHPNWWDFNLQMTAPLTAAVANKTSAAEAAKAAQAAAEAAMRQSGMWKG
ncbi:MAG: extracellular solute-binding protein [Propionicimonas sp.]